MAALVPFFVADRSYTYAVVSGVVLAASLMSSVVQPVFGVLTDRWAMPWPLPAGTLLGGVGIALSGLSGSYALTLVFVSISGIGVAAYHPESARVARIAGQGSHRAMGCSPPASTSASRWSRWDRVTVSRWSHLITAVPSRAQCGCRAQPSTCSRP